jgi:CHAT domain
MAASPPEYDDLQLRIDRDGDGAYRVLALGPDGRIGRGMFMPPISDQELDSFVQRVGLARRARGASDTRMEEIRDVGSKLFDALLKEQVGHVYQSAQTAAQENGRGLRINLRLSGAPELMRLPWEFLDHRPRFLSQSMHTPLVRSLDLETARRPQKVELPLRILAVVSSPSGYPELDAADERRKVERALSHLRQVGLVDIQWLKRATLGELGRRIAEPDDIHVLHYIGHGAYDEATESGILVLETAQGRAHDVSGEDLGAMLQDEQSLRLVVLNSCEGARTSLVDPFSGVATSLIEFDIPAVIGMQFEITDEAASPQLAAQSLGPRRSRNLARPSYSCVRRTPTCSRSSPNPSSRRHRGGVLREG